MKTHLLALATASLLGLSSSAFATSVTCDIVNASANGSNADACIGGLSGIGANPTAELAAVNSGFGGDPFTYVDKTGDTGLPGFELTVTQGSASDPFLFSYTLKVPTDYAGRVVDWVLGIKQANDSFTAYLFENVTLGIEGGFNSFWLNPGSKLVNDYSHATGFIRPADTQVPEPISLSLLGIGLLGVGAVRRLRKAA